MRYLSVYSRFVKLSLLSISQYRATFIMGVVSQLCSFAAELILLQILISKFKEIGGWSSYEVLLLYSINLSAYAWAAFFLNNPSSRLPQMIKDGSFDEVLTKPLNHFLYLISREFNNGYVAHVLISTFMIIVCFIQLGISFTLTNVVFLVITIFSGALIQGAGFLLTSAPAFWFVESSGIRSVFFFEMKKFISYPISIYNKAVQVTLTFVLPYAFISYYPAQLFLDNKDFLFHPGFQYLSPLVGILLFALSYLIWIKGLNKYQSTGS